MLDSTTDPMNANNAGWKCLLEADRLSHPLPALPPTANFIPVRRFRRRRYYELYCAIGQQWGWTDKHHYTSQEWRNLLDSRFSEIMILQIENKTAGIFHLDFHAAPDWAVLELFGLMPEFIGKGLSVPFLGAAMMLGLYGPRSCRSMRVSTCSEDHPRALQMYKKLGFRPRHTLYF